MMRGLMTLAGDVAHERKITVSTYAAGDDHVIIEGRLTDERLKDYYLITGEKRQADLLHDFVLRLYVRINDMTIEDIETEMKTVPREECRMVESFLERAKGLKIEPGFSSRVKALFQGIQGCTHLVHLITTMAPAAMQGVWSHLAQKPNAHLSLERAVNLKKILINSCYAWREDGIASERLNDTIRKIQS